MEKFIPTPTISEILKEEFMDPLGLSAYRLAKDIHVPVSRIQEILNGTRSISADTSLRLAKYFGVSCVYRWMLICVQQNLVRGWMKYYPLLHIVLH